MKENGKTIKQTERGHTVIKMGLYLRDNGKMISR